MHHAVICSHAPSPFVPAMWRNYGIDFLRKWLQNFAFVPRHEKTCLCICEKQKTQISLRIRAVWSAALLFAA